MPVDRVYKGSNIKFAIPITSSPKGHTAGGRSLAADSADRSMKPASHYINNE